MPRRFARTRRRCCGRSMTFTGTRARAGHQPVPAGGVPAGRAGARTSQSYGAVRERAGRPLPAAGARPGAGVGAAVGEVIRRVLAHPAGQAAARSHPAPAQGTGRRRWTCCSGTACRDRHGTRAPAAGAGRADRPQSRAEVLEPLTREPFTRRERPYREDPLPGPDVAAGLAGGTAWNYLAGALGVQVPLEVSRPHAR